ncbi:late competence development ComFB family protein [Anabaena cylindrica UHCC 0172]|uniref:late competence development ComFB family protein n=1 Tax=Anabaena cylindrica TaxID=1165 RepID=UPI002B213B61|nr:late competence development ComFB family protein [Anabaena cylindrica]MEA5553078.1 late competence development ComFB family protein [Anabaena cylindrica UHCC 0172]
MSNLRPSLNSANSSSQQTAFTKDSHNVMEMLVVEEVEKQIKSLPVKTADYIKASEVVAYALNRLPCLYATSKRGWQRQWHHGKTELYQKITTAVRQGIIAVQRDPLRVNDPLNFTADHAALNALEKLKILLQRQDLSWDNLSDVVEQTLLNESKGRSNWRKSDSSAKDTFNWEKHQM